MTDNKPYIDPQVLALLEPMWNNPEAEIDWDNLSEKEVIALRAPAAAETLKTPRLGPDLPRVMDLEADGAFGKTRVRLYDPLNDGKSDSGSKPRSTQRPRVCLFTDSRKS